MEIFGIGLPELLLIGVIALVVLGPDRLPDAARTLGKAIYDFRRALEPARSAWADVQRELTTSLDVSGQATANRSAGDQAAAPTNPWKVHPLADGLSPEERDRFFNTGELPQWKLDELEKRDATQHNGNGAYPATDMAELDYPMPHAEVRYEAAPPHKEELEELDYPEPGQ